MRLRPGLLGGIEQEARKLQIGVLFDEARQFNGLLRPLHPRALASGVTFDHDAERPAGDLAGLGKGGHDGGVVGGGGDGHPLRQGAEPADLCLTQQIVTEEDIIDAAVGHHFGLAELLTRDACGPGGDLHLGEHRAFVRLDVRAVRHARQIAQLLDAADVALHPIEIDHDGRGANIVGDL